MAAATALAGMVTGDPNKWTILSIGLIALILLVQPLFLGDDPNSLRWLPRGVKRVLARPWPARLLHAGRAALWASPFILLLILDLMIPSLFIVPQLAR
jgi:hypothetical protein